MDQRWHINSSIRWPEGAPFAACLTHDIDVVHWGTVANAFRRKKRAFQPDLSYSGRIKAMMQAGEELYQAATRSWIRRRELDLGQWIDIEENRNIKATYYFATCANGSLNDPIYELGDYIRFRKNSCSLAKAIGELAHGGAEIGLHGSIYSNARHDLLAEEKKRLDDVASEVLGIRQHHLLMEYPDTFCAQAKNGFRYDSSLGFNHRRGMRCGTCFPWLLEHFSTQTTNSTSIIWELPLVMHDVALPPLGTSSIQALRVVEAAIDEVSNVGGVFTLLWHNYVYRSGDLDVRKAIYREIIEELQWRGAWIATGREVIDYWISWLDQ